MKTKKGEGLALQTIVIAALVLVVLIVSVMIFTKGISPGKKIGSVNDCTSICDETGKTCPPETYPIAGLGGCPAETPYCCKQNDQQTQ